jgi:hypothetical protein
MDVQDMSILISGDFHNNTDKELFSILKTELIAKYGIEKYENIKYQIILGDAGFLWNGNYTNEIFNYNALNERPFPVLCVFGNHDPVLGHSDLPEVDIGIGEKVIVVRNEKPFIAYLKRGRIYNIENYKFLVLGGALSIDKSFRKPKISWWKEEYWSKEEEYAVLQVIKSDNKYDYVLSHTGPTHVNETIKSTMNFGIIYDKVAALNERIDCKIFCKQWFCGHWHRDKYYYCQNRKRGYQYLYRKTALLEGDEIEVL